MSLYLKRALVILFIMLIVVAYLIMRLYKTEVRGAFSAATTLVIDAGHGEPDGGAVGAHGTVEAGVNLKIAEKVRAKLKKRCYNVLMTRETDAGIYSEGATIRDKKRSDMHNRQRIMNESGASAFISIHMNTYTDSHYRGAQVFYSENDEGSARLAHCIQTALLSMDPDNTRVEKAASPSIYLMKQASLPAVIVECGFLSNPEEESLLNTEEYQERLAESICKGIEDYFMEGGAETDES